MAKKTFIKKLYKGSTIEVDNQIRLWRQRMKAKKLLLGKNTESHAKRMEEQNEDRELERNGGIATKKFFE